MKDLFAEEVIKEKPKRVRNRDHHKKKNPEGPSYPNGTSCTYPGCITRLSTTNLGPYCRNHADKIAKIKLDEDTKKYNYDGMPVGKHSTKK